MGYSPGSHKRTGHDLVTKQQQLHSRFSKKEEGGQRFERLRCCLSKVSSKNLLNAVSTCTWTTSVLERENEVERVPVRDRAGFRVYFAQDEDGRIPVKKHGLNRCSFLPADRV